MALLVLIGLLLLPLAAIGGGLVWLLGGGTSGAARQAAGAVVAEAPAPAAASLNRVHPADQGINFAAPLRPGTYPLQELSTGKPVTEEGEPVYVNRDGARVRFPVRLHDTFADPGSGWVGGRAGGYAQGEYRVLVTAQGSASEYARHPQQYRDFIVRTDARLDRPTDGMYLLLGFRFRQQPQGDDGYVFVVTPDDRSFRLELWQQEGGTQQRTVLLPNTVTTAISPETTWNRLAVSADGPEIMLFVNGHLVGRVRDEALSSGSLMLGVGKSDKALPFANGDGRFADLMVTEIS